MTTSLFTTTLAISFLVVATPHLLPCPVDNRALADSADPNALNTQRRRRRRIPKEDGGDDETTRTSIGGIATSKRECPIPKPGGLIGQVLGVKKDEEQKTGASTLRVIEERRRADVSGRQ
jgi:cytochrome c oxidase assembly factor 2